MSSPEPDRLRSIFDEAVSCAPSDRARFVRDACNGDSVLLAALEELLAHHTAVHADDNRTVFQPGETIAGRFEVARFMASGGMGEVYEAHDLRLNVRVALKTIRDEAYSGADALARFEREIRLARAIAHPNVCRVFEFIEHRAVGRFIPCLIMELVEGETLAAHLRRQRPIPLELARCLARGAAEALDCLHAHGIVHRDVKPDNIMLTPDGPGRVRPVLMDFGLARQISKEGNPFTTLSGFPAGAPFFLAPELLRGEMPSAATDIYAFGLVLDEMVTSTRAFNASSIVALCYAKLWEKPVPPQARARHLPAGWCRAIEGCTYADPARRFPTAGEAIAAIASGKWSRTRRATVVLATVGCAAAVPMWIGLRGSVAVPATAIDVYEIENQAPSPAYDYLCRGITSEIIRMLALLEGVNVASMHSTRPRAPRRGNGALALNGLLQAQEGRVRFHISLENNRTGSVLWSRRFDRSDLSNTLEMQGEIAIGIVATLQKIVRGSSVSASILGRFLPGRATLPSPTTSSAALDAYMMGQHLLSRGTPQSVQAAIRELTRAIEEDPRFALAYAALAHASINLAHYSYSRKTELHENARQFAEAAVSLAPRSAECHEAMGESRQSYWDWSGARESYRRALQLQPRMASARRRYAGLLIQLGRVDEGVTAARLALEHDPYNPSAPAGLGLFLFLARRYEESRSVLEPAAQRPDGLAAIHNLGDVYAVQALAAALPAREALFAKAFEQAARVAEIEKRLRVDPRAETPWSDQMFANYYSLHAEPRAAQPFLDRMLRQMNSGSGTPANAAMVLVAQGRVEEAIDLLERAVAMHDPYVPLVRAMPFFDSVNAHPRFRRLLAAMGM